ncbi:ESX secretion-associated protein EspG [Prauserella halophila]|uniref:ESX secretion-associated protein EspG n=1 Tax=Prauserella halophila TaxID=185641 RepID=UPI0020A554BA|nr:ESX secretion-associated protein EspG [Prauserella halophila]
MPRTVLLHLWELERLGEAHPLLSANDMYVPLAGREEFTRECFRALAEQGLAQGDTLTRDFRVALRVIASPDREIYCWSSCVDAGQDRKVAVMTAGGEAVAMQVKGETVGIVPSDERRLVEDFVTDLPERPPATTRELHTSRAAFDQRDRNHDMFASRLTQEKELEKHLKAPREAVHQVYVAGNSEGRHRRSKPFSVIDIRGQGRVLTFADGQDNLHCLPGTPANLTKTLTATWQSL